RADPVVRLLVRIAGVDPVAQPHRRWLRRIKVDREEMPDVDHVYVSALQALDGCGSCRKAVVDDRRLLAASCRSNRRDRMGQAGPRIAADETSSKLWRGRLKLGLRCTNGQFRRIRFSVSLASQQQK